MLTAAPNRFLICRLNSVSEVILTLPVACALKDHFPECWIGWVVEEPARSVVHGHRAVDETITLPTGWSTSLAAIRSAKAVLRSHSVNVAIDCQGSVSSALAGKLSGARRRIGYAGMSASKLNRLLSNERIAPVFSHLTDRSLELLTPLGIHTPQVCWDVPISQQAKAWAKRWRLSVASRGLAIMTPSATWTSKRWDAGRFASTADYIHDRYGYRTVIIWDSYDDRLMAEEIVAKSKSTATLAPHTDFTHLAAMIRTADLFIGGDCETLHLAVAVGTQSIGLYGASRPCDSGPYGHIALQRAYEHGSLKRLQRTDNAAMKTIGVEHVCQVIDEIESGQKINARIAA